MGHKDIQKILTQPLRLNELIQAFKGQATYAELEKRSNGTPSHRRWKHLGAPTAKLDELPRLETLKGIAVALGIPDQVVLEAAARSVGVRISHEGETAPLLKLIPEGTEALTVDQVRAIITLIQVQVDSMQQTT